MQYAFDADSNLIYYRSQMDYTRPFTLRFLKMLQRYDALGNVSEQVQYTSQVCEPCGGWFPQFDTLQYQRTEFHYTNGKAYRLQWSGEPEDASYYQTRFGPIGEKSYADYRYGRRIVVTDTLTFEPIAPAPAPLLTPPERKKQQKALREKNQACEASGRVSFSENGVWIEGIRLGREKPGGARFSVTYRE